MYINRTIKLTKLSLIISLLSISTLIVGACGNNSVISQNSPPALSTSQATLSGSETPQTVHISPSYVNWYTDLKSLKRDAILVVAGTVTKINPPIQEKAYARTTSVFNISEVLSDPKSVLHDSNSIVVNQVGGTIGNTVYRVEDNPLFKEGEQAILFLDVDTTGNLYYVIGGPSGRFTIKNDQVTPATDGGLKVGAAKTKAQFVTEIKTQPLVAKPVPTATVASSAPERQAGQSVNFFQLYTLDKAQSILVKAGSVTKSKTIAEVDQIKTVVLSLNKALATVEKPAAPLTQQLIYVVFVLSNGKTIGFEYNPTTATLTSNPPDNITVIAPEEFVRVLALS